MILIPEPTVKGGSVFILKKDLEAYLGKTRTPKTIKRFKMPLSSGVMHERLDTKSSCCRSVVPITSKKVLVRTYRGMFVPVYVCVRTFVCMRKRTSMGVGVLSF